MMLRQEIGCEMIWQNDGRRSDLLVSWGAVGKTERVKHKRGEWYGKAREQSFTPRTKPLSFFRSPFFVLHPNELCVLDAGSVSGAGWYVGWGHGGVFL